MWTARTFLAGTMLALVAPAHAGGAAQSAPNHEASAAALHFIQDDPSTALAEAKKRGVPVFVEAWAPW
jgi:4-hydroxyphenylpyruvate dioxygenase-like putative hemolysin